MQALAEVAGPVDRQRFEAELLPRHEPLVLRGQVAAWPLVSTARRGDAALLAELEAAAAPAPVDALLLAPVHRGRIFYGDGAQGFNFVRNQLPLAELIAQLRRYGGSEAAPALAVQSAPLAVCAPALRSSLAMPLLDTSVAPRLWLGNRVVTPAHFDESANIACVVAGRRRFTLFPPEQVGNLAVGPIGHAPTGTPISLVDFEAPDLQRFPRFAQALAAGRQAELAPGDALYIPPLWWHHVASLAPLNLLLNYWWKPQPALPAGMASGLDALLHAMACLAELPPEQRRDWQRLFAHWVFEAGPESLAHLPPALMGVHGRWTPALREQVRAFLAERLAAPGTGPRSGP